MSQPDEAADRPGPEVARRLQEELPAIEPSDKAREDMLQRILKRTVRGLREWLNRSRGGPDN